MSRALITGASSGIGEAFARRLAKDRVDLVLVARRDDRLKVLATELTARHGIRVEAMPIDLSAVEGIDRLVEYVDHTDAPFEFLVGSAGFGTRGPYAEVQADKITRQVRLHVEANARITRAVLPAMIQRRAGTIVLVSSLGAFMTTTHYTHYSATKTYLNMLALGLRDELRGTGVRVQSLCPGVTRTEFMATDEYKDFKYDDIPAFLWANPEEVVEASLRELSEERPIVVPGLGNKAFVALMQTPAVGPALRAALGRLGRGKSMF